MSNENAEYEKLTKDIYETILKEEGLNNIKVDHDVKILGKSGCCHQIDVYWEFKMAGVIHRIAIECKNYSSSVSIAKIRDFFGVIHDIGNIKGIFITKVGYQSGAIKFGEYYGIDLKELRFPSHEDWEGRIKDIHINMKAYTTQIKKMDIIIDKDLYSKNDNYKCGDEIIFSGINKDILVIDDKDKIITNLYELENLLPCNMKDECDLEKEYKFDNAYIYDVNRIKIKINSIVYKYDILSNERNIVTEGEKIAKAILKDVRSEEIKFFYK
ncbi:restriction endonuclease [Clostridium botulinum]